MKTDGDRASHSAALASRDRVFKHTHTYTNSPFSSVISARPHITGRAVSVISLGPSLSKGYPSGWPRSLGGYGPNRRLGDWRRLRFLVLVGPGLWIGRVRPGNNGGPGSVLVARWAERTGRQTVFCPHNKLEPIARSSTAGQGVGLDNSVRPIRFLSLGPSGLLGKTDFPCPQSSPWVKFPGVWELTNGLDFFPKKNWGY